MPVDHDDLIITSRRMVTHESVGPGTVRARGGRIIEVLHDYLPSIAGVLDSGDSTLMPALVDTHVHVNEPGRTEWEGFRTAGRAAAAGGISTIAVMPLNCSPVATTVQALVAEAGAAASSCLVDYAFWGGLVPGNIADLKSLWNAGVLGFKCFLVHSGIDDFPNVTGRDLAEALPVLRSLAPSGAVLLAHAEDPNLLNAARVSSGLDARPRSYAAYLASRPEIVEARAISLLIDLAMQHKTRIHIVHISASTALASLAAARRNGVPISTETCPHYLALAAETIPDGRTDFKCAPPIRDDQNRDALWNGLRDDTLDLIVSDHSPCPPELKHLDTGNFATAWGGIASLQLGLPVVWTHARSRSFSLSDIARWMCSAPARLAGIDARKGHIAVGADADLVIWDPDQPWTVNARILQHRHKITPYDGVTLYGVVQATFIRGQPVFAAPNSRFATLLPTTFPNQHSGAWIKRT